MNDQKLKLQETMERYHHAKRRTAVDKMKKPVIYDGREYESIASCARKLRVSSSTISKGLKHGVLRGKMIVRRENTI